MESDMRATRHSLAFFFGQATRRSLPRPLSVSSSPFFSRRRGPQEKHRKLARFAQLCYTFPLYPLHLSVIVCSAETRGHVWFYTCFALRSSVCVLFCFER